jgi:hypothetical protein
VRPAATGGDEAHVWWRQREEMRLTRSGGIGRRRVGLVEYGQGRALRASGVWVGRAPRPHLSARCFQRERDTVEARFWSMLFVLSRYDGSNLMITAVFCYIIVISIFWLATVLCIWMNLDCTI